MLRVFAGRTSLKQRYKLEGTQEQGWQAQAPHKTKQSPACKGADTRRGGNSLEPTLTRSGYASLQRQHQRHSLKSHKHSQNGTYRVLMCLHRPLIQLSLRRFARRQACGKRVPGQRARRGCCANAVLSMSADLHANPWQACQEQTSWGHCDCAAAEGFHPPLYKCTARVERWKWARGEIGGALRCLPACRLAQLLCRHSMCLPL